MAQMFNIAESGSFGTRTQPPLAPSYLRLSAGAVRKIVPTAPTSIRLLSGGLWLTIEGQQQDYFLKPGHRLELEKGKAVVIEAGWPGRTGPARYVLQD